MERNVAIYLRDAENDGFGLGEFENHLAIGLARHARRLKEECGVRLLFIVPPSLDGTYGNDVRYIIMDRKLEKRLCGAFTYKKAMAGMPRFDLLHITHQGVGIRPGLAEKTLMTVHDVNFFHNGINRIRVLRKAFRMSRRLKRATHLSFISHFTEGDVKSHFDINVPSRVIYNGVTDLSGHERKMPGTGLPESYFLHISRLAEKKNVHLLVRMMKYLPEENLVLAGRGRSGYEKRLRKTIEKEKLSNVYMAGHVTAEGKAALLGGCKALLFPSKSEGFGLPVAEAMCFGKPVFLSNLTSLPEVGGREAYYFDTLEPEAMAATVISGMDDFNLDAHDKSMRIKKHVAIFDWDKTASEFVRYYLDILGKE